MRQKSAGRAGRKCGYSDHGGESRDEQSANGAASANSDAEALPAVYADEGLKRALEEIYGYVRQNGTFKDGLVPEIPPLRAWVD